MLTTSSLPVGSDSITATYGGTGNYSASTSSPLIQTVSHILKTTTTLASSLNPSTYGQSVTFTATVSPAVPNDESVTFYNGGAKLGTGWTAGGIATLTTSALAAGTYSITAAYIGDANYPSSTSSSLMQTVNQAATTTTLVSSLNPSSFGQSVTLTATVSPSLPNGETVTFYNSGVSIGAGTTSGGIATLTTSSLPAGSDSVTAAYAGDANYVGSTSSALTQVVNMAPGAALEIERP
jgi:hypothetical protein